MGADINARVGHQRGGDEVKRAHAPVEAGRTIAAQKLFNVWSEGKERPREAFGSGREALTRTHCEPGRSLLRRRQEREQPGDGAMKIERHDADTGRHFVRTRAADEMLQTVAHQRV